MATHAIDEILRRPARHWSMDGIAELLAGSLILVWGMAVSAQQLWPSRVTEILAVGGPMLAAGVLALFHRGIAARLERLKARWTYPRIGYVKLPEASGARKTATAILGAVAAAVAAVVVVQRPAFLPLLTGAVYAAGAAILWARLGIRRLVAYALLALAAGAVAQWALPARLGVGFVMCAAGLSWAVGGGFVLRDLLRQPALPQDRE